MFYLQDTPDSWFREKIPANKFNSVAELQKALKQETGIKVATWFETAYWVSDCLASNDRGYYLVQDIEESYCVTAQHKEIANNTYKLGLKHLATSKWVSEQLASRFGLPSVPISLGLDFDTFKPVPDSKRDMFRVLTQCRVWSAGPNLKGWNTAKQAVEKAFDIDRSISLVTFSIENKQECRPDMAHIHIHTPNDKWLNELYNTSGLYLLTSNHEGFGLTAAEAMLVGIPVVATLADGNNEFCIHGKTALTAQPGDSDTLAKHIVHLFQNQDYAASLAKQGQDFIKQYTWERSIDALEHEFFGKSKPLVQESINLSFVTSSTDTAIEYPKMPKVKLSEDSPVASIIIPTVNDFVNTKACIESIKQHTQMSKVDT
jgi:glycosyltransferase involved in cell wall biosynthesis